MPVGGLAVWSQMVWASLTNSAKWANNTISSRSRDHSRQQNLRVLDDQKLNEDNQKLRCGCPPDYQFFFGGGGGGKNDLKIFMCNFFNVSFSVFPISIQISV